MKCVRHYALALLYWLLASAACGGSAPPVPTRKAICELTRPRSDTTSTWRAGDWTRLLLVAEQRGNALYAQTLCDGQPIEHTALPADCEVQTPDPGVPEAVPINESSVIERLLPDNKRLVWIMTHRFPNGDGFGPVAAATVTPHAIYVGSLGLLRMRPTRVDLALWQIGHDTVLMAAGETCETQELSASCRRAANLLVFDHDAFHAAPIQRTGSQECIDAAWVELDRQADLTLDNGWNRHMHIVATLNHDQRYVVITEQVEVADTDPKHPDIPARDVRRIDAERFIHVDGPRFFTRQLPLWPRVIEARGATKPSSEHP
jgi:hypothetical protein